MLVKQKMIDELIDWNLKENKVFDKRSQSTLSVGKSVDDGIALLAATVSNQNISKF